MAVADRILALKLIADTAPMARDLRKGEQAVGRMGTSIKRLAGIAAGAFAGLALVDFAKGAIEMASSVDEATSKLNVLLGSAAKLPQRFARMAAKIGLSEQKALDATSTFAQLFRTMGIGRRESARQSVALTRLAADMASFSNTSPEEAIQALAAGLRGESEPLRRYGVLLDDASLRAIALKKGIIETNRPLSAQEKALAALALIFKQTSASQGDFERTSGGLANTQRRLAAKIANLQLQLGRFLAPIFANVVTFLTDELVPAFEALTSGDFRPFIRMLEGIGKGISDALFGAELPGGLRAPGLVHRIAALGGQIQRAWDEMVSGVDWGKAIGDAVGGAVELLLDNKNIAANLAVVGGALAAGMFVAKIFADAFVLMLKAPVFLAEGAVGLAVKALGRGLLFILRTAMFLTETAIALFARGLTYLINSVPTGPESTIGRAATGLGARIQKLLIAGVAFGLLLELRNVINQALDDLGWPRGGVPSSENWEDVLNDVRNGGGNLRPQLAPAGGMGPRAGITVNVFAGVGDPVEIGRQVDRVLRSYRGRAGS